MTTHKETCSNALQRYWVCFSILLLFGCGSGDKPDSGQGRYVESESLVSWPNDVRYYRNIKYGSHELQAIDLWIPAADKPVPIVIYIHGGGFIGGDKSQMNIDLLFQYLGAGFAYASVNYRLTSEVNFPETHLDCSRAVQFLRHRAEDFNLDPTQIAGTGGSAGAGICLWLAMKDDMADPGNIDPVSRESTRLTCVAVLDGQSSYDPYFLRTLGLPRLEEHGFFFPFYGIEEEDLDSPAARKLYREAAAINFATEDDVPVLLNYSPWYRNVPVTDETHVSRIIHHPKLGVVLKEKLDTLGVECLVRYFGHPEGDQISEFEFVLQHLRR